MTSFGLFFFLHLVAGFCYSQDYCRNMHFPPPLEDHALFNHTLQNITDISLDNCKVKCYVNQACHAVNYKKGANLGSCELLSAKAGSFPIDLLRFPGIDFYGPTEVCVPNPCPSTNMTCVELKGTPRYRCECPQGYTGATCETDIDECSINAANCHVDANCINTAGSFTCICKPGYTGNGVSCTDINECLVEMSNCHGNATCANTAGSFTCTCEPWYTGDGVDCIKLITHLGCYQDSSDRAVGQLAVYPADLTGCLDYATGQGYTVFAMENTIECFTGANANKTYSKHGPSDNCINGVGGRWALDVYRINYVT
ncbi:protein kinase C-binding protein NELL2 [Nematostella vectensis]|uniref:protein kinase C-binding protein NELL2 n=1 Tax=Nematostella vectensis TaxID=45351 RepID=UPI002076ED43|nr:protein kinase C-binding protein NELL2 [Nematostella vectensis]